MKNNHTGDINTCTDVEDIQDGNDSTKTTNLLPHHQFLNIPTPKLHCAKQI